MLKRWLAATALTLALAAPVAFAQSGQPKKATAKKATVNKAKASSMTSLSSDAQKQGYAIGADLGKNLKMQNINVDIDALVSGLRDGFGGGSLALSDDEMKTAFEALQKSVAAKAESKNKVAADENTKIGQEFLANNAKKPGVVTTASGLQYEVLKQGDGPMPSDTDMVTTHYHGTLIDGTVFDSSVDRGQPASFPVNGVIKGWQEALKLMKVGSKYRLFVPPALAYGERGAGGKIGPNATLIFEVELIKIGK